MTTVTQWFDPCDGDQPINIGNYQRDYRDSIEELDFWDGLVWRYGSNGQQECINQNRKWRGLAEKPQP